MLSSEPKMNKEETLVDFAGEDSKNGTESEGKGNHSRQGDSNKREDETDTIMEIKDKDVYDGNEIKTIQQNKTFETNHNELEIHKTTSDNAEHIKNDLDNEQVEVFHVNSIYDKGSLGNKDMKPMNASSSSDSNFKRKVTFSKEIIVIAYDDMGHTLDYNYDEQDAEDNRDDTSYKKVFGHCQDAVHDEMRVNYADTVVNRNIFKTVSFSNEVTVIQDGNLVFTTNFQEYPNYPRDKSRKPIERPSNKVDKLLYKLKKVVKKLEEKSKYGQESSHRDKKVLGDAEQDRSFHQVEVVKVEKLNEKQVAFSDQVEFIVENRFEQREPNLRKVTFSKEIIVIAYPSDDDGMMDASRYSTELLEKANYEEIEQNSVNYTNREGSSGNVSKTVSFSNEVTVIHDANLVFRCDSTESLKDDEYPTREDDKEIECEECDQ